MTKNISYAKLSGFAFVLALAMVVGMPQAKAESPNILVGQDLTVGSTGQGVVVLQGLLSELGYLQIPTGVAPGYFGNLTKAAVARYQAAKFVSPTAGYFGPLSKIAMHQDFSPRGWLTLLNW